MTIIGQDKVIKFIDSNNISTIPRTIMLEGSYGSGKHSICQYISNSYGIEIEDISDNLTYEKIEQITFTVEPRLYIIDTNNITVKNENAILKFLEEPLKNALIVLLTENKYSLLDTIINRCHLITLNKYKQEVLEQFITDNSNRDMLLKICTTPGDIISMQDNSLPDMLNLCNKIFDSIHKATYANALTISDKMAYKNEKDKYNFKLFFKLLNIVAFDRYCSNVSSVEDYKLTNEYYNRLSIKNIDKKMLFENYLLKLKNLRRA